MEFGLRQQTENGPSCILSVIELPLYKHNVMNFPH